MSAGRIPVVLHAHFYQPPRDNPWTETVEREPSAAPFHDWNERISAECYAANACARVLGPRGRISDIVNNYAWLSFNVGPTLFSWLATHQPHVCQRIVHADRESAMRNNGHGNAIAQAFSHAILPLCNERDRNTQIRWGIADFQHRFGRRPEAMWLPETACDVATAEALAAHGMRYIILSPYQAARVRYGADSPWREVPNGSIDPRQPYRLRLPSGRCIACFFYDGPAAHSISFEAVLDTSRSLAERLLQAAGATTSPEQIVHIATDGETYGHHRRFADRALAYFVLHEAPAHGLEVTNYAAFLERNEPKWEVELARGPLGDATAWSCAHGIGRWSRDCGCNAGAPAGWNQKWRAPLRAALDMLRDRAAELFENIGGELLREVWSARDAYIEVVLDPRAEVRDAFLRTHGRGRVSDAGRVRAFQLLEAQRMTQLMYASCGWFFNDLAGLETTQILKYAAMAIELLENASGHKLRPDFEQALAEAKSNVEAEGNGADVFRRRVLPWRVTSEHRIAHRSSRALFSAGPQTEHDAAFQVTSLEEQRLERGSYRLVLGRARVIRVRTEEAEELTYAATTLTERDMHCGVQRTQGRQVYEKLLAEAQACFVRPTPTAILRLIDRHLGEQYFSASDLSEAARSEFIEQLMTDLLERLGATYGYLYDEHRKAIEAIEAAGVDVPHELRLVAEYTLARRLDAALVEASDADDTELIREALSLAREAADMGVRLTASRATRRLERMASEAAVRLSARTDGVQAQRLLDIVGIIRALDVNMSLDRAQETVFELARKGALKDLPRQMREDLAAALGYVEPSA